MDKSLGTVVQFERFLTHAKLYTRATNTVRPSPSPHPTDSVETVKAQFRWAFNIVLGGEGGGDMDLWKDSTAFCDRTCETHRIELRSDCPWLSMKPQNKPTTHFLKYLKFRRLCE